MADTIFNNKLDLPVSIRRTNDIPLDDSFVFTTIDAANAYITSDDSTAYAGQVIYIINEDRYYSVVDTAGALSLKSRPNTRDIRVIDAKGTANNNTIAAKVKISTSTPTDRELVYDTTNKQLKIGTGSGSQVLSPKWEGVNATFNGNVKANTFTLGNTTLDADDFELINKLSAYEIFKFKVNVYDASDSKSPIEELNFNFRADSTWEEWSLANTSAGFRCVKVLDADSKLKSYIRYKNSFLVYSDESKTTQVSPDTEISSNGTYYCDPAEAAGPITNITFDADSKTLNWTNPVVDTLPQAITGIRILYRTDRYPENESDIMYVLNGETYEAAASNLTGYLDLNDSSFFTSEKRCSISIDDIENLEAGRLYYLYITPCTASEFYTESNYQRCLVFIPEAVAARTAEAQAANTSNTALETLLGV